MVVQKYREAKRFTISGTAQRQSEEELHSQRSSRWVADSLMKPLQADAILAPLEQNGVCYTLRTEN